VQDRQFRLFGRERVDERRGKDHQDFPPRTPLCDALNDRDRDPTASQRENLEATIHLARNGDKAALGRLLEAFRSRLRTAAERDIRHRLQARVDASDIVQQTFLSAYNNFDEFGGKCEAEFAAWLEQIQNRNILDAVRVHVRSGKRSVDRELSQQDDAKGVSGLPDGKSPSPSHAAIQGDERQRLLAALEQLPPDQREAVRMRHLEGKTLAQIMEDLERSKEAAAALIKRGLANLRKQMRDAE